MEITRNGIILNKIKYGDNAIICNVYTNEQGKQSYLINNSIYKKNKTIYLNPLQIIEFEINYKNGKKLQAIKSTSQNYVYKNLPFNVYKSSIAVFISQLLNYVIQEEAPNKELYEFIEQSVIFLDNTSDSIANFHLFFMINLSRFLGYYPNDNYSKSNCYFDLKQAQFTDISSNNTTGPNVGRVIHKLLKTKVSTLNELKLDHSSRNTILNTLLHFFELHNDKRFNIKSLKVIREIFS